VGCVNTISLQTGWIRTAGEFTHPTRSVERHPATVEQPAGGITTSGSATVRIGHAPDDVISHRLDDNELGLKDTVRVNPNEVVDIVVRFEVFCRYRSRELPV